jgi:hypothetical protein
LFGLCQRLGKPPAFLNARGGKVSARLEQLWRIVLPSAPWLTFLLTVAVHRIKKLFIYAGFNNLNTDRHGFKELHNFVELPPPPGSVD